LASRWRRRTSFASANAVRALRRSCFLVGICVAGAAAGAPRAEEDSAGTDAQELEWRTTELPGGLRLALARSNEAPRVRVCAGFVVPAFGRDGRPAPRALVDLEMRRDSLAVARQSGGETHAAWRGFEHVDGDTVVFCLVAPRDELTAVLSALVELARPVAVTADGCRRALDEWQQGGGLVEVLARDSRSTRLQALAWLSSGSPPPAIALALQRIPTTACDHWQVTNPSRPAPITLAIVGDFEVRALESEIRSHRTLRQYLRGARAGRVNSPAPGRPKDGSYPRFVRLRATDSPDSVLLLGWPITRASEREALGARVIAAVIEHRLNRLLVPREQRATTRVTQATGHGTLEVEVRPTPSEQLRSTEAHVFAIIDQLGTTPVSSKDFDSALRQASRPTPLSGDLALDGAVQMAQRTLFSWNAPAMGTAAAPYPTATELQQWAMRQSLIRANAAEVFFEAVAPQKRAGARSEGQGPKGHLYVVRNGESLQMIARRFRVTIPELIRVNRLRHPDRIAPGTRLLIPTAAPASPSN